MVPPAILKLMLGRTMSPPEGLAPHPSPSLPQLLPTEDGIAPAIRVILPPLDEVMPATGIGAVLIVLSPLVMIVIDPPAALLAIIGSTFCWLLTPKLSVIAPAKNTCPLVPPTLTLTPPAAPPMVPPPPEGLILPPTRVPLAKLPRSEERRV